MIGYTGIKKFANARLITNSRKSCRAKVSHAKGLPCQGRQVSMQNAVAITRSFNRTEGNSRVEQSRSSSAGHPPAIGTPDEELIARVCWREEEALGAMYDRYQRLVFAIALRTVGDRELAEEVVQDVFQAVWQSAGSFQPGGNVSAWLI